MTRTRASVRGRGINRKASAVRITVNGEERIVSEGTTVSELLKTLELDPRFLAVERNRELVPRTRHQECQLCEGDEVEIVTLVGGG